MCEYLNIEECRKRCPSVSWQLLNTVDSTNLELKRLAKDNRLDGPMTLIAERQLNGYGRYGRQWVEDRGASLKFSTIYPLSSKLNVGTLSPLLALKIYQRLTRWNDALFVKWPNDLVMTTGKIAGILLEVFQVDTEINIIVGVGINLFKTELIEQSLGRKVGFLFDGKIDDSERVVLRTELLCSLVHAISECIMRDQYSFTNHEIEDWNTADLYFGSDVSLFLGKNLVCKGLEEGIDKYGRIRVRSEGKTFLFSTGEVSLRNAD